MSKDEPGTEFTGSAFTFMYVEEHADTVASAMVIVQPMKPEVISGLDI